MMCVSILPLFHSFHLFISCHQNHPKGAVSIVYSKPEDAEAAVSHFNSLGQLATPDAQPYLRTRALTATLEGPDTRRERLQAENAMGTELPKEASGGGGKQGSNVLNSFLEDDDDDDDENKRIEEFTNTFDDRSQLPNPSSSPTSPPHLQFLLL